jgi:uncharacterized protein (UPF0333 family)
MWGQAAFEYLLLFSLILGILTFLTFYAQQMTDRNREEIMISNAAIAVNKIVEAADIVYSQGKPSQITLSIYISERVDSIVFSNKMIIMRIGISSGFSDIFATSKAPLQGYISTNSGTKRIRVKAEENYVNITEV